LRIKGSEQPWKVPEQGSDKMRGMFKEGFEVKGCLEVGKAYSWEWCKVDLG
jgi:hypothetical protein